MLKALEGPAVFVSLVSLKAWSRLDPDTGFDAVSFMW